MGNLDKQDNSNWQTPTIKKFDYLKENNKINNLIETYVYRTINHD